jgi:crotonobetainyl-CoA:carnitine CoA-transferase CaiB-like acyl-CoA transferase
MERKRPKVRLQPPKIGEHNKEILLQYGFEKDEIQSLYRSSILTDYKRIKTLSD